VLDPECGALVPAREAFDGVNVATRIVACPWPPSEDAERLADVIAQVERAAITKAGGDPR
jgi:hypothetical protein